MPRIKPLISAAAPPVARRLFRALEVCGYIEPDRKGRPRVDWERLHEAIADKANRDIAVRRLKEFFGAGRQPMTLDEAVAICEGLHITVDVLAYDEHTPRRYMPRSLAEELRR